MTIPAGEVSSIQYQGNGVTVTFPYTFTITQESDLRVVLTDGLDVDTVLTLNIDYTVTGVGDAEGGTITLVTPPAANSGDPAVSPFPEKLTIIDNVVVSQETPFGNQGNFSASLHESAFDKLTRLVLRVSSQITGSVLRLPETVVGASPELPKPRALALFRWNQAEDALETVLPSEIATSVAFSDFKVDQFDDGAGYESGVSTSVTLSEAAGIINNTNVYFDGVYQPKDTYTMPNTTTLDFGAPIAGTPTIEVVYGTAVVSEDVTTAQLAASAASSSAALAATSEGNAANSETNAATSESNALSYANSALSSRNLAATSESNAATSEANALSHANDADADRIAAAAAAAAAGLALDTFTDQYLGAKSSAPTLDNDGEALQVGALYFDTTLNGLYVWNGSIWQVTAAAGLGTAAQADAQTSPTDTTPDALMAVGAFGLGGNGIDVSDFNTIIANGFYKGLGATGAPDTNPYEIFHIQYDINSAKQIAFAAGSVDVKYYVRVKAANIWRPWQEIYHTGNEQQIGVSQTWQTPTRAVGGNYVNSTGKPILVSIYGINASSNLAINVSGIDVATSVNNTALWLSAIVPDGATYSCNATSIFQWKELR